MGGTMRLLSITRLSRVQAVLVLIHYHDDHFGATAILAEKIPVGTFVDHGPGVEFGNDDAWWQARRGPWFTVTNGRNQFSKSYPARP